MQYAHGKQHRRLIKGIFVNKEIKKVRKEKVRAPPTSRGRFRHSLATSPKSWRGDTKVSQSQQPPSPPSSVWYRVMGKSEQKKSRRKEKVRRKKYPPVPPIAVQALPTAEAEATTAASPELPISPVVASSRNSVHDGRDLLLLSMGMDDTPPPTPPPPPQPQQERNPADEQDDKENWEENFFRDLKLAQRASVQSATEEREERNPASEAKEEDREEWEDQFLRDLKLAQEASLQSAAAEKGNDELEFQRNLKLAQAASMKAVIGNDAYEEEEEEEGGGGGDEEWETKFDDESGYWYYENRITGETYWAEEQ
eukprot:g529.t1